MLDAFNIQFECRPKRFEAVLCLQHCCPFGVVVVVVVFICPILFSSSLSCSLIYLTAPPFSTPAFPLFHQRILPAALFRRLDSESNKMHGKQFPLQRGRGSKGGGDNGRLVSSSCCCFSERLFPTFPPPPIVGLTATGQQFELEII